MSDPVKTNVYEGHQIMIHGEPVVLQEVTIHPKTQKVDITAVAAEENITLVGVDYDHFMKLVNPPNCQIASCPTCGRDF